MPRLPLLVFPAPAVAARHKLKGRTGDLHFPAPARQTRRVNSQFGTILSSFHKKSLEVRQNASGATVEQVLVLETVGSIEKFSRAVRLIEGFEWLTEWDQTEIPADDDFYRHVPAEEERLSGRLYLVMSNQRGLRELLSLWRLWKKHQEDPQQFKFPRFKTKFRDLFSHLREIRVWGPQDRTKDTGLIPYLAEQQLMGRQSVRIEIELWFRSQAADRDLAAAEIQRLVPQGPGGFFQQTVIPDICYHGIIADVPTAQVQAIAEARETMLLHCDQVMFFRPIGQTMIAGPSGAPEALPAAAIPRPTKDIPIVCLLDGHPLANHSLLRQHLIVDDPDNLSPTYSALDMKHGTGMASLIIHGDLNAPSRPLDRKIYCRTIMQSFPGPGGPGNGSESIPDSVLPTDMVFRAIKQLFDPEGEEEPVAPSIRIVNLSVCERFRPFFGHLSPWARMLDFLAWRYKLLFIVSAGNHTDDIVLAIAPPALATMTPAQLTREFTQAIERQKTERRLLSPSESINALTVASSHSDTSVYPATAGIYDPHNRNEMPSPINAQGPGFRSSVKPDFLLSGGRQLYSALPVLPGAPSTQSALEPRIYVSTPGHRVATPGAGVAANSSSWHTRGTSNSAALATRAGAQIYEMLLDLQREVGEAKLPTDSLPLLVKSLLVHGASWRDAANILSGNLTNGSKQAIQSLLGYGNAETDRVLACEDNRATLLGFGRLAADQAHIYKLPLPPSLAGQAVQRKLTITLSWFSPINPKHNLYRRAALWFAPKEGRVTGTFEQLLQVDRAEADSRAVRRGTLQHEIFQGSRATAFTDGTDLEIQVNCKADAGELEEEVPYAIAISLEVPAAINIPIYQEVQTRIEIQARARVPVVPARPV